MKELKDQLQAISDTIAVLAKQFELLSKQIENIQPMVSKEEIVPPAGEMEVEEAEVKKAEIRPKERAVKAKKPARKAKKPEAAAREAVEEIAGKPLPVLATVLDIIRRSRKGVDIAQIKAKTQFTPRQISNALYKLSKIQGKIEAKARGVYVIKKK